MMHQFTRTERNPVVYDTDQSDASQTYRTSQSQHSNRAQQWRQTYRNSQSTTCVSFHGPEDPNSPIQSRSPAGGLNERERLPRFLPVEPYGQSSVNVHYLTNSPGIYCQSEHGSFDSLRPPQLGHVSRASSFDGRYRNISLADNRPSPTVKTTDETDCKSFRKYPERNRAIKETDHLGRRERLVVAPSIEISLAGEYSDTSDSDENFRKSFELKIDDEIISEKFSNKPGAQSSSNYTETYSDSAMSGSWNTSRHSNQLTPEGHVPMEANFSARSNNRPKLTRQPRSFQAEPMHQRFQSPDTKEPRNLMDEFEYFCKIANSPSGSKDSPTSQMSTQSASLLHSRKHLAAARSHSMRTTSPEPTPLENRSTESPGQRNSGESGKPSYLRPPARGQLRRASTEEDRLKRPFKDRLPVSATLSYSSVNASVQNVCRSPPKSVPKIPSLLAQPPQQCNIGGPIGMPITEDSLVADEPGMTFYQVQVLGGVGVGKTSLCQQLSRLTTGKSEIYDLDDEENCPEAHSVTAALRGSVYTVNFLDTSTESFEQNLEIQIRDCVDAFIVMYAIDDSSSYDAARLIMNALGPGNSPSMSPKSGSTQIVAPAFLYLVANKTDLVRGRQVTTEDGRNLANAHDAKFIEISASLNHLVAELFVSLVTHLRESEQRGRDPRLPTERRTKYNQSSLASYSGSTKSGGQGSNTFRIPSNTKSSLSRFFRKHFTRPSDESD